MKQLKKKKVQSVNYITAKEQAKKKSLYEESVVLRTKLLPFSNNPTPTLLNRYLVHQSIATEEVNKKFISLIDLYVDLRLDYNHIFDIRISLFDTLSDMKNSIKQLRAVGDCYITNHGVYNKIYASLEKELYESILQLKAKTFDPVSNTVYKVVHLGKERIILNKRYLLSEYGLTKNELRTHLESGMTIKDLYIELGTMKDYENYLDKLIGTYELNKGYEHISKEYPDKTVVVERVCVLDTYPPPETRVWNMTVPIKRETTK